MMHPDDPSFLEFLIGESISFFIFKSLKLKNFKSRVVKMF